LSSHGEAKYEQIISYRGQDNHIYVLNSFDDVEWNAKNATADLNSFALAAGDPTGYYRIEIKNLKKTVVKTIVYRGMDGCIHQLVCRGQSSSEWTHQNISLRSMPFQQIIKKENSRTHLLESPSPPLVAKENEEPETIPSITDATNSNTSTNTNGSIESCSDSGGSPDASPIIPHSPTEPTEEETNNAPPILSEEAELRRANIVHEIYTTEKHFVKALEIVVKYFADPIYSSDLLPQEKANILFGSIEILLPHHKRFLELMEQRVTTWSSTQLFGDLFLDKAQFLVLHSNYANNYVKIIELLKKEVLENQPFAAFMKVEKALVTSILMIILI
jgi:hypothetical protein